MDLVLSFVVPGEGMIYWCIPSKLFWTISPIPRHPSWYLYLPHKTTKVDTKIFIWHYYGSHHMDWSDQACLSLSHHAPGWHARNAYNVNLLQKGYYLIDKLYYRNFTSANLCNADSFLSHKITCLKSFLFSHLSKESGTWAHMKTTL